MFMELTIKSDMLERKLCARSFYLVINYLWIIDERSFGWGTLEVEWLPFKVAWAGKILQLKQLSPDQWLPFKLIAQWNIYPSSADPFHKRRPSSKSETFIGALLSFILYLINSGNKRSEHESLLQYYSHWINIRWKYFNKSFYYSN